jgi:hypothetical protein
VVSVVPEFTLMVHLAVAFGLTTILVYLNRKYTKYPSFGVLGLMLLAGAGYGLFMDYILGYRMNMWFYTHHAYYRSDYFAYLIPAWAMVLTCFALFYNLLIRFIANIYIRLLIYFAIIPLQQEFMGIGQHSWIYNASPGIIGVGWIILLESCMILNSILSKLNRREVKIEGLSFK